jgi:PrsW family intramembrane metalloprotease
MPKFLRWVVLIVGICIGVAGLSMLIGGIVAHATSASDNENSGAFVVAIVGGALFALGWLLGMLSFSMFTAIAGLVQAFCLLIGGVASALFAVVVARADPLDFDPNRAASDGWLGAGLCLAAALALLLNWVLWTRRRGAHGAVMHFMHVVAIGYGSLHFVSGLSLALLTLTNMAGTRGLYGTSGDHLETAVAYAGLAALYAGAGAILVWHGCAALTGVPSSRFQPPPVWLPLAALAVTTTIGAVLIQSGVAVGFMPPAQAVAVVMPGLALLAFVSQAGDRARAARRSSWRELLLMAAYGAIGAATIAAIINTLSISASLVVALAAHGAFDRVHTGQEFSAVIQNASDYLSERDLIAPLLASIAVLGPLNEEFWKGFGVRLLRDHRPSRYRAFIWGVASGVGFGAAEVTQYGLAAFHRSPYRWWDVVLVRGAASSMHALASGMVGIAWFYAFAGRRLRFFALYLLAVCLHGSWNALSVLTSARVLPPFKGLSDHDLEIVLELLILPIAAVIVVVLGRLARRLAADDDVSEPLSSGDAGTHALGLQPSL